MKRKLSNEDIPRPLENAYISTTDIEKQEAKEGKMSSSLKEAEFDLYSTDLLAEDEYFYCRIFFYNLYRTYGIIATLVFIFLGALYLFTNTAIYVENLPFLTTEILNWIFYAGEI